MTLAAVLGCMIAVGEDPAAATHLAEDVVPAGRGERRVVAGRILIDDSYNANPDSMRGALRSLPTDQVCVGILGEMRELGRHSAAAHQGLQAACNGLAGVVAVGAEMRPLYDGLRPEQQWGYAATADDIDLDELCGRLPRGAEVLIKGSNGVFWTRGFVDRLADRLRTLDPA